jgi:hypothetical protein
MSAEIRILAGSASSGNAVVKNHFTEMEVEAIDMMIAAEPPLIADALREQLRNLTAIEVESTGVGFFKYLELSANAQPLSGKRSFTLRGVHAVIDGRLDQTVMFVLFVKDGLLRMLESVTLEEKWPEKLEPYRLEYTRIV